CRCRSGSRCTGCWRSNGPCIARSDALWISRPAAEGPSQIATLTAMAPGDWIITIRLAADDRVCGLGAVPAKLRAAGQRDWLLATGSSRYGWPRMIESAVWGCAGEAAG